MDNIKNKNLAVYLKSMIILPIIVFAQLNVLAQTNSILIYTDIDNLISKDKVDLVLFCPGHHTRSEYLLLPFGGGGLNLISNDVSFIKKNYRSNIIFSSIEFPETYLATIDVVENILNDLHKLSQVHNIRNIYLIGISSGGALVLNLASLADNEIKNKISGIIAAIPITDLQYTLENIKDNKVKDNLLKDIIYKDTDGTLEKKSSPITYVDKLPNNTKISLIVGTQDIVVDPRQVEKYFEKAKSLGKNIRIFRVQAGHDTDKIKDLYSQLILEMLH